MISSASFAGSISRGIRRTLAVTLGAACLVLAACGGSADAPPPPEGGPGPVPPTITQQPADLTVTAGQPASFTVAASGTAPLAYQWQRNGVAIAGATTTTYTIAATVLADSGAVFRAVVTNVAGSATSNNATLTVVAAAPVLTITQQPANTTVVAGTSASFSVAATCSSGTLVVQWQRSQGSGANLTFGDVVGATALSYMFSTVIGDSGTQFRAMLSCSGQSTTASNAATLTVTPPGTVTLSLLPLVGLRDQAEIPAITGIDQDASGSFTFITGNRIKRLSADLGTITPVAGSNGSGSADGAAATATFNQPFALTQDSTGIVYVADSGNSTIRRIALDGTVSTLAGLAGATGTTDGTGSAARFDSPSGIALGPDGDLYVAERNNHLIRRVTTAGVVTTYAGSTSGYLDAAAPLTAKFNNPFGVAVAANGDVLVGDVGNNRIRRIVRNGNVAGPVQTLAGNGTATPASPDGIGAAAVISSPYGIVVRGNTLTLRDGFGLLRQIDLTSAAVTTLTGSRTLGEGYADGTSTTARIRGGSLGVTGAANGGFMLGDADGLRLVSAAGAVLTLAQTRGISTTPQGVGVIAQLPFNVGGGRRVDLTLDPAGNIVVADEVSMTVRRIDPAGVASFAAGLVAGRSGPIDGVGSEAQFFDLWDVITDSAGVIYVSDGGGSVRRIDANNATTLFAGSTDFPGGLGYVDGNGANARFNFITGLAFSGGNIFVGDRGNNVIRRIDPAGNVTTYAGVAGQSARVDGPIATARFQSPNDVVSGPDGSLYVLDKPNNITGTIRRITPDGSSVSTLAGSGGLVRIFTIDSAGTIYYADDFTSSGGLWMLPAGGTVPTLLIPYSTSAGVILGANPRLAIVDSIVVLGPKRILLASGGQLLVATLP